MGSIERKLKILSIIIDMYVKTGEPVGSKAISKALNFSVSSATIRSEMAELSTLGFLEQPHTSSGRIPTAKGYRLYINKLMHIEPLSEKDKNFIYANLLEKASNPEELLQQASHLLTFMTNFTAISTKPSEKNSLIKTIQLIQASTRWAILILITTSGNFTSKSFKCQYDLNLDILRFFHGVLNQRLKGVALQSIDLQFIEKVKTSMGELQDLVSPILSVLLDCVQSALKTSIHLEGQTNLLFLPELDLESAKRTLEFLNQKENIIQLLDSKKEPIQVIIGFESEIPELRNTSMVISRYNLKDLSSGVIGVIGPTRMDYAKLMAFIHYLAYTVGEFLDDLFEMS